MFTGVVGRVAREVVCAGTADDAAANDDNVSLFARGSGHGCVCAKRAQNSGREERSRWESGEAMQGLSGQFRCVLECQCTEGKKMEESMRRDRKIEELTLQWDS